MKVLIALFKAQTPKNQKIIALSAIALIIWGPLYLISGRRSSAPRTQIAGAQQSQPKRDRFISSGSGISFYERSNGCVVAKGVTVDYLRKTNKTIGTFRAEIERKTGKSCVLFE